jgi:hypothetical protein
MAHVPFRKSARVMGPGFCQHLPLGSMAALSPAPPAGNGYVRRFSPSDPHPTRQVARGPRGRRIPRAAKSPSFAALRYAPALRVQSGWAGLF